MTSPISFEILCVCVSVYFKCWTYLLIMWEVNDCVILYLQKIQIHLYLEEILLDSIFFLHHFGFRDHFQSICLGWIFLLVLEIHFFKELFWDTVSWKPSCPQSRYTFDDNLDFLNLLFPPPHHKVYRLATCSCSWYSVIEPRALCMMSKHATNKAKAV